MSGSFTGTAKGMGDVSVTLTLTDSVITDCTATGETVSYDADVVVIGAGGAGMTAAEIAQPGSYSWPIVDQAMADASSAIQGYIKKGYTKSGATYEELAKELDMDPAAFAKTMETWNGYVESKNGPDFGRTCFANPLNNGPFYAIKVTAGVHHTMGGVTINSATEVLKADGTAIPGLFAAGEVTGGVHGANRLGGTAVADFVVFGRIAGDSAAAYASTQ